MSLYIATCDMDLYYVVRRFISSISHDRIKFIFSHTNKSYIFKDQFLLLAPMATYLEDLTQSIGRYSGL